jgi:hypothetical protein
MTGTSPLGLLELVSGFFRSPTPAYGSQQPAPTPSLFCSLFGSPPTPPYVRSETPPLPGPQQQTSDHPNPSSPRTGDVK